MSSSIQRIGTTPRFSEAVIHNQTVYLAGQVSQLVEGDIRAQTDDVLQQIDTLLAKAGTDRSHLLSAQIWLKDMADYAAMNQLWDAWLANVKAPVRACVQAPMAKPHYRIEVLVIAAQQA
ncbi:RidA family protein [Pseudomonas sp. Fl5BN2]|uniref:RidA family protein n=1 Tax=unclassified Pseudomonas TaxID=196821 RepID=UPI0013784DA1|nr:MULTISPECIES: RidA family protein [unclassified Pseudomonas]NBF02524.1 RidA family protein [Pseudomonas sp. Fl5BN2]NBF12055.1 RidA family protein [Pseudomonas sp. Fl4BN1]